MNTATNVTAKDLTALQRNALMQRVMIALRRDPRNIDALLTLAGLQGAEENFDAAIATLHKALALKKKSPDILRRLLSAANDKNDLALARKYARKLVEVEPRNADNYRSYGLIVELMGNAAQAIDIYKKAEGLHPRHASTLHDIGRCYGLKGDHASAVEYYRKSLEADPHFALALYNYAASRKFTREEADAFIIKAREAATMEKNTADGSVHANLHYAMGKVLDETGRTDEAFEEFRKANDLRKTERSGPPMVQFLNLAETYTRETFAEKAGMGNPTRQPIFIVGMPRSGTTLTESICGAHSKVTAGDEQTFISEIASSLGSHTAAQGAYARSVRRLDKQRVLELAESYLNSCKHIAGDTPHFTDKLPHNFLNIGLITLLFPNAPIILCRRHPLDNCFSLYSNSMGKYHNEYKTDLTRLGLYYRQYCQLVEHWKTILPGRFHEVFYEDMVANTELNARSMIAWLGLEWEDGVMARNNSQRSVRTLSGWQVRQPVYQTSKGKWRAYEKQLAPLREAIGPYVESYERELEELALKGAA
jgi:tetratricopeptide (TPR) repeat protein